MSENLKKMYEYQIMDGRGGYEYVVMGAEVSCKYGSKTCVLNLERDYGAYTSDGRPLIIVSDSKEENVKSFGMCNKDRRKPCKCKPKLGEWIGITNANMIIADSKTGMVGSAVLEDATAYCLDGGIVSFKTSGQASPSYSNEKAKDVVEIVEDIKGIWKRSRDNKDFLGHVKVKNDGIYNLYIYSSYRKDAIILGRVFIYEVSWGKLKVIDEYDIQYNGEDQQGETIGEAWNKNHWEYRISIALYANKNYYLEIECYDIDELLYKLIGNFDREVLSISKDNNVSNDTISGIWVMNNEFKKKNPDMYRELNRKSSKGTPAIIMYLNAYYVSELSKLIDKMIEEDKHWIPINKAAELSENFGWASLFFTGLSYALPMLIKYLGLMGSTVSGIITGGVSAGLGVIGGLFTLSSKSILKDLKDEIVKRDDKPTKIILYDTYLEEYGDNGWGDYSLKPFTISKFEVREFSEYRENGVTTIYGNKYLEGKFILLTGYSTEVSTENSQNTEKLKNSLKSNEWIIR